MHTTTFFTSLLLMSTTGWAQYRLQQDYFSGGNFLDQFTFFTGADPTNGFVDYVDQGTAQSGGLVSSSGGSVRLGVNDRDTTTTGRQSVRLTSKQTYQSGLVILDLAHMPGGICGTWPAFWMVGPNWPTQGEIDIIEGVNNGQTNQVTLHTGSTCNVGNSQMLGHVVGESCDVSSGDNAGCGVTTTDRASYGTEFNQNGGGTYATEWTPTSIAVYFFPRGKEPADINSGNPDPSGWGVPVANFAGGCDIGRSFTNQQIVFDTTFCGDWAGAVWGSSGCAQNGQTCEDFVGQNPSAFKDAYWTVNGLKVFSGSASGNGTFAPSRGPVGGSSGVAGPTGGPNLRPAPSAAPSGAPAPAPSGEPSGPPAGPPAQRPGQFGPPGAQPAPGETPTPTDAAPPGGATAGGAHRPWIMGGHAGGDHHFGPPSRADWVEAQTIPQNRPRATDDLNSNIAERHVRHLEHHRHRHG